MILLLCRSSDRNLVGKTFMTFSDTATVNRKVSMSRNTCANRLPLLVLRGEVGGGGGGGGGRRLSVLAVSPRCF